MLKQAPNPSAMYTQAPVVYSSATKTYIGSLCTWYANKKNVQRRGKSL